MRGIAHLLVLELLAAEAVQEAQRRRTPRHVEHLQLHEAVLGQAYLLGHVAEAQLLCEQQVPRRRSGGRPARRRNARRRRALRIGRAGGRLSPSARCRLGGRLVVSGTLLRRGIFRRGLAHVELEERGDGQAELEQRVDGVGRTAGLLG